MTRAPTIEPTTPPPASPGTAVRGATTAPRSMAGPAAWARRPAPSRTAALRLALGCAAVVLLAALVTAVLASAGSADPPPDPVAAPAKIYRLPLSGLPDVARAFERPPAPWAAGHRGVDLRSAPGAQALSPVGGVVTFAGSVGGRGVVTVRDGRGRRSSVEPVVVAVHVGDRVVAGQPLGIVTTDASHCPPGTCLHWGVREGDDTYVDPLTLIPGAGPVVLLPLGP